MDTAPAMSQENVNPKTRPPIGLLLAVVIPLALGACGGNGGGGSDGTQSRDGNADQIVDVINESATSSDPDKCTASNTQRFLEQTYGVKGKAAVHLCERTAALGNANSVKTSSVSVHGETASAKVAIVGSELDGQTVVMRLVKQGDQWKLDQTIRFISFDREAWNSAAPRGLREVGLPPSVIGCVTEQFKHFSDSEVQDAYLKHPRPLQRVIVECAQNVRSDALS